MKFVVLLIFGILCHYTSAKDIESAKAIQIVSPKDHSFILELSEFRKIVENDNMKDRHVVAVSIAGPYPISPRKKFYVKHLFAVFVCSGIRTFGFFIQTFFFSMTIFILFTF